MEEIECALPRLEDILCQDVAWLVGTITNLMPREDLNHILQMTDSREKVSAIIQKVKGSRTGAWTEFINCVCMNCQLPIDLEVQLLSLTSGITSNSLPNEDSRQRRIEESASRYREQIRNVILQSNGSRGIGDPRGSCNPMFVEPLVKIIKLNNGQRSKAEQSSGEEPSSTDEIKDLLFQRTHFTQTHSILVIGMPGTGKTMMAHRICYQWAQGEFDQYTLTFLFEFRQLNRISRYFTLRELLFKLFVEPDLYIEEAYEYVIKNPHKVLIIFDGLDELVGQFTASPPNIKLDQMTSISQLFSCILYGTILQGCTVIVTCRSKLLNSYPLDSINQVIEVLGFNKEKVEKYVDNFFNMNALKENVLYYLRDNSKLMHLCFIPALCHIVCICLEHLLNTSVQSCLPQTITQFYIEMLKIFIKKRQKSSTDESTVLKKLRSLIFALAHLALNGLDENKTVFYSEEIAEEIKNFAPTHGLLSVFEVKRFESNMDLGYSFVHLSSQEFFAALYLITNDTLTPSLLHKRLNLKSKGNLKFKTKEELTDQFHIFLSGLSSKECQPFLLELSEQSEYLIKKKQETILESLEKLAENHLSGPKLIELCHCIYETQDRDLAKYAGKYLADKYELRNLRITPVDMTALMFVVKHGWCLVSLNFAGCPMELECLEVLGGSCENVESLSFKSQKYGDTFAQALSTSVTGMKNLKRIRLTAGFLTSSVIGALKRSFLCCPSLQEINLQGNHLKLKDMNLLLELFSGMNQLKRLDLSHNVLKVMGVLSLVKSAVTHHKIRNIQIKGDIPTAVFSAADEIPQSSPPVKKARREMSKKKDITISLECCNLKGRNISKLLGILTKLHPSSVNLSGNPLGDDGCKSLIDALPKLQISRELNLCNTQISEEGVLHLTSSMKSCPNIKEIFASNLSQKAVIYFIPANDDGHRAIRINGFRFHCQLFDLLCSILQDCRHLTHLDLSANNFENASIGQLTKVLPHLKSLHSVNISGNNISLCGIQSLAEVLSTVRTLRDVDISFGNPQKVILTFQKNERYQTPRLECLLNQHEITATSQPSKSFSLTEYRMTPQKLQKVLQILSQCPDLTQINLTRNAMSYKMITNLLKHLPKLPDLTFINISQSDLSSNCLLLLANSINLCRRITEVDIRSADNIHLHLQRQPMAEKVACRLNSCRIGKNDVVPLLKVLTQNPYLQEVSMCMNHLSQDGILVLLTFLTSCTRVTHITACLNPTETIHIVFCGGSLKTIRLAGCGFQTEHIKKLCTLVQRNDSVTKLKLKKNNMSSSNVYNVILAMSQMSHESIISIEEPWMEGEHLTSFALQILEIPARIKAFSVLKNKIAIEFHGHEENQDASSPGLKSLRFNHCEADLQNVSFLPSICREHGFCLTELDVSNNSLGDVGVQTVAGFLSSLPSLLTIKLARVNMSHIGVTSLTESIQFCKSILKIMLPDNDIGEKGALVIKELLTHKRNVKAINVSGCFVGTTEEGRQFLAELSRCTELEELHLLSMSLDDASLLVLSQGLAHMPSLKILELGNNKITSIGIQHLTDSLVNCPEMEVLDLSCNSIEGAGADRLAAVLPRLKNMKKIRLQSCGLGKVPGNQFVDALISCHKLENISLSENAFPKQNFLKLVDGLQNCTSLKTIHFKLCGVCDSVCKSLAKVLGCSKRVEEITLSWNSIGDEGSCALARVLKQMGNLKILDLEKNQIKDEGVEAMAQALARCPNIRVVRLWSNPVSRETQEKLQKQDPRLNFSFF